MSQEASDRQDKEDRSGQEHIQKGTEGSAGKSLHRCISYDLGGGGGTTEERPGKARELFFPKGYSDFTGMQEKEFDQFCTNTQTAALLGQPRE